MVSVTLSVPKDLKEKMERFDWLNWSSIAREAIEKRLKQLEALEEFRKGMEKSKMTDKDCMELGKKIKESMLDNSKSNK